MKRILFIFISVQLFVSTEILAQTTNLSSLDKKTRDSVLIAVAKETILKHAESWYREDIIPVIEFGGYYNSPRGDNNHRQYYSVTYYVDKAKDQNQYWTNYMAKVYIFEDTGKATQINVGNGTARTDLDKEVVTRSNTAIPQMQPYRDPSTNPYKGMKASDVWPELLNK